MNNSIKNITKIGTLALSFIASTVCFAEGYHDTTGIIKSRIGSLEYIGGYPTAETSAKAYDYLDIQRATQAYLDFMPMASINAFFESHIRDYGWQTPSDIQIFTEQGEGKAEAIGLTYNTESIYASAHTDLKMDDPTVIETPPKVLGMINDSWQRWVQDLGNTGPDKGKGGRYLLLPPDYEGDIPEEGYFVVECPTYRNWIMLRGFVQDTGTGEDAINYYKKHFKIYPLKTGPRKGAKYTSMSFKTANTTHPRDIKYFELLNKVVQHEPSSAFTPYQLGLLKSLGIEKAKEFKPDERMKKLLAEGIEIGDAIAKTNSYANRYSEALLYDNRKYETPFVGGSYEFKSGDALWLDMRTLFHYLAIAISPAMSEQKVGIGSQYLVTYRDSEDAFLMGDKNYKLHLPVGIPAKDFWSVTIYHPDTRSLLQNGEGKPSVSTYDNPITNNDGSVDIWFGPNAPAGKESNWIKTISSEGWFTIIRLYGPLESFFDKTWKPDDIVKIDYEN